MCSPAAATRRGSTPSSAPSSRRQPIARVRFGLEDSFDGLIEPDRWRMLTPRDVTGILRIGGTILGTTNRGNPFAYPIETTGGKRDYSERCVEMFHAAEARRAGRHRRRRHAGHRPRVPQARHPARRRPQDHRQRHRRDDEHVRLRHGGQLRHRRDRPAAHHRRSAPPRDGRRGDGPLCRLDCALCRRRRRRRRHPDSRDPVRPGESRGADPRPRYATARASASSSSPKARSRSAARCRCSRQAHGGVRRAARRHRRARSPRSSRR